MLHNVTEFEWTENKHTAAQMLAEDDLPDHQIAASLQLTRQTLARWKQHPTFAARVKAIAAAIGNSCLRTAIARRSRRLKILDQQLEAMQTVIRERGADPAMQVIPGGKTGLLVIKETQIVQEERDGKKTVRIIPTEVAVDTGLLKEIREHLRQAAEELGQCEDDSDNKQKSNRITVIRIIDSPPREVPLPKQVEATVVDAAPTAAPQATPQPALPSSDTITIPIGKQ